MLDLIFIILRHVSTLTHDRYWKECYQSIRKFHPEVDIIIIDDNSSYPPDTKYVLYKCRIIDSKYPQRGEFLPYYYFYQLKLARKMVFLHDSVFIKDKIPGLEAVADYKFIWEFNLNHQHDNDIPPIIKKLNNGDVLLDFFSKATFKGCLGGMTVMTWSFLEKIEKTFNFFQIMIDNIVDRNTRMCFERIIACICTYLTGLSTKSSIYGDIFEWCSMLNKYKKITLPTYEEYDHNRRHFNQFSIVKIGSSR